MCGVAGIIDYKCVANNRSAIESMLCSINYRGPDESGIYLSRSAVLGNVRLSIIDIAGGQQPLSDATSRYWIVFNGEIFNYLELKEDLVKKGVDFRTDSDTEVLIELYALYGKKCLEYLNGQFAIAIWDNQNEELFIARDRVGIRPLFYNIQSGVFSFASEIKSIFQLKNIERKFSNENLSQIFTFWTTITPNTAFDNIYELPPGHWAIFNRKGFKKYKYWDFQFNNPLSGRDITLTDAIEKFHELFTNAVQLRLRADVEVAAYLSGGIDSSASVAYIKNICPGILNTFSIGFEEKAFDESKYQEEAVKYFNTTHKSLNCSSKNLTALFPKVVWHSEIPLTRTAPAPMLMLSELVRECNIKVVITGEGSDEILAGYDIFKEALIRRSWASRPDSEVSPLRLKKLYLDHPHMKNSSLAMLKLFFGYKLNEVNDQFYSHLIRWNNSNHIKKHFSSELKNELEGYSPLEILAEIIPENFSRWDPLAKAQWLETTIFMSGYLLSSQGDRMSMANSVEGRYPFLDYRLIEYCNSLPSSFKLKGLTEKYLLKKLLTNKIPKSIINRQKQPYRAPVQSVFLSKESPEYVKFMLSDSYTKKTGIFNEKSVSGLLSRIEKTGIASETDKMVLTSVISTHLLHYMFIENHNTEFQSGKINNPRIINDF